MVGNGGSSAGSYLANPTSPIPSHCAVSILFQRCPSTSIVVTSTLRANSPAAVAAGTAVGYSTVHSLGRLEDPGQVPDLLLQGQ